MTSIHLQSNLTWQRTCLTTLLCFALGVLSACGGGGGGSGGSTPAPAATYAVGGKVNGLLSGQTLVLVNTTNSNTVTIAGNGSSKDFVFSEKIPSNGAYNVQVKTSPANQTCSVGAGVGSGVTSDVTNINVVCSNMAYPVSGAVSGLLSGKEVRLSNNGGDVISVSSNTSFSFPIPVAFGAGYDVRVDVHPAGQSCAIANSSGTIAGPVTNVVVTCSQTAFTVGGNVTSLTSGNTVTLLNNDNLADPKTVGPNASFTFDQAVTAGQPYNVTVKTAPAKQACTVTNGSGTMPSANITTVGVGCVSAVDKFAYVTNSGSNGPGGISMYTIGSNGTLTFAESFDAGSSPVSVAIHPNGKYAYVVNEDGQSVWIYTIGTDGRLSRLGSPVDTGVKPSSITIDSEGTYAYVPNRDNDSVWTYTIGADGGLTRLGAAVPTGPKPVRLVIHPTGDYAYVVNNQTSSLDSKSISQYSIANGVLSPRSPAYATSENAPYDMTFTPDGAYAFVTNNGSASVSQYSVANGLLTALGTPRVTAGTYPVAIVMHPLGLYAYVTNGGSNNIMQFSVTSSGLTSPTSVTAGSVAFGLAMSSTGSNIYVTNNGSTGVDGISQFSTANGVLTPLTPPNVSSGIKPEGIAIYK